jgi:hypothetical protein
MKDIYIFQIKLLIENKLVICALGNLHYKISRENLIIYFSYRQNNNNIENVEKKGSEVWRL